MAQEIDTLIVGGGMAGMFCGMRLKDAGLPFLLLTERLGGRVMYKPEFKMNFGAVFYFDNYHHVKKILTPGPKVIESLWRVCFHRADGTRYGAFSPRILRHGWQLLRFLRFMKTFGRHYEAYKRNCETMQAKHALEQDPFLGKLFVQTAEQLIDDLDVAEVCRESVSLFAYACTGAKVDTLTGFDYCYLAQGLLMPIRHFVFDEGEMRRRLGNVVVGSVTAVERVEGTWVVSTAGGDVFRARTLVMATTAHVAQALLGLPKIRSASRLYAYLVKGVPREAFRERDVHLFPDTSPVIYLARRHNAADEYELFSNVPVELDTYFERHELRWMQEWPQAIYTHPGFVLDQDMGGDLYIAGDHNGMGMEPAAISGIYAANRIIGKAAAGASRSPH